MFYQRELDRALRFGDVLKGYVATTPCIPEPTLAASIKSYEINVELPKFCIVVSPCCSIGKKTISLAPLIEVLPIFFKNPYFEADLTGINRRMKAQQAVSPSVWRKFPPEEQERRLEEGLAYTFLEFFIYAGNGGFPEYVVNRKEGNITTRFRMIDFRNVYRLNCDKINTPEDAPLDSKVLQLSIETRSQLRDKMSYYYGREPEEDRLEV